MSELERIKVKEQNDVDKLEAGSLASFFYHLAGKKDERISKEKQEAYAAAVKYDGAVRQMESVCYDLSKAENELISLENCEIEYEKILDEKKENLILNGAAKADEILMLDKKIGSMRNHNKEVDEALTAGNRVLDTVIDVIHELESADGWSTFDILGGGLIADAIKYSHLDSVQKKSQDLQIAIRRFQTELSDVKIHSDLNISIGEFLRFADYFFDGIFTDWAVKDRINSAMNQYYDTKRQILHALDQLEEMRYSDEEIYEVIKKLDDLIING